MWLCQRRLHQGKFVWPKSDERCFTSVSYTHLDVYKRQLLNEARELSERIIDELHAKSNRPQKKKPRTYREIARKAYLSLVKLRRPSNRKRRAGIRQQLQFLHRNLNHIEAMLTEYPLGTPIPLPNWLLRRYWVLPHLYRQQYEMYKTNTGRCDDRIVSISQPYLRPIIRRCV